MSMCYSLQLQRQMRYDSLPLRSSQSIEHKQQIKYWSCLLASWFFYLETPFHLCLAAIHTSTQRKQDMWQCTLEEPRYGAEACHVFWRDSLSVLTIWEGNGEKYPPQSCRNLSPVTQNHLQGLIRESKNKTTDTPFIQTVPALAAETSVWPLCEHSSPSRLRDLR